MKLLVQVGHRVHKLNHLFTQAQFVDLHVITLFFVFADLNPSLLTRVHLPKRANPLVAAVDHTVLVALVAEKVREAMAGIRDELRGELKETEKVLLTAINCREPSPTACSPPAPPSDVPSWRRQLW